MSDEDKTDTTEKEIPDNVVNLNMITRLDIPAERVIHGASEMEFEEVVIIGCTKDGNEYFASNVAAGDKIVWHLERAKYKLLKLVEEY